MKAFKSRSPDSNSGCGVCMECGKFAWLHHGQCTLCNEGYQSESEYDGDDDEEDEDE